MNILALESGATHWGLAVVRIGDEVEPLAITVETEPRRLARDLFARIGSTLAEAQMTLDDIDALAAGIGPGSWTGLRVGLTAMKTLAQTRSIPICGVPSFDPIAQAIWRTRDENDSENDSKNQTESSLLLVTGACRPDEWYGKIFECGEDYLGIAQPEWIGNSQLLADTMSTETLVRGLETPILLAGAGTEKIAAILQARGEKYSQVAPAFEFILIELAIAAAAAISSGESSDPMTLAPLYLAPSNAERNLIYNAN